ncbi:YdcF family protein [Nocardiopsis sp. CNT-189]|uniref:ElyC/SanA/YdcF family protein n=1 Tax=Nocardiopsis oceanisediminis TaxID=2816862 RepID=UPI003B2CC29E
MDSVEAVPIGGEVHAWARELWDFHTAPAREGGPARGDVVLALGSHDLRVAGHAARLWHEGAAPLVVFSGDRGRRTGGGHGHARWERREAEVFADASGLPDRAVLLETRATNTGENFSCSRELCARQGVRVRAAVATAKPYMARRALAAAAVHWPGAEWRFRAFGGGYEGYPDERYGAEELVSFLVGDLQRLVVYPRRGWAAPVHVPDRVAEAYDRLVRAGFTEHLVPGEPPALG